MTLAVMTHKIKHYTLAVGWGLVFVYVLVLLPASIVLTSFRNATWADPVELWRDAASKSPNKPRPFLNTGYELHKLGRIDDALVQYERAFQLADNPALNESQVILARQLALTNISEIYMRKQDLGRAYGTLKLLWSRFPGFPAAAVNLSKLLADTGHLDEALGIINEGIELGLIAYAWYPNPELLYLNRAEIRRFMGDRGGALSDYEMVVSLERDASIIPECMY